MKQYVNGFLFSQDASKVALITKDRPIWQSGKINGIGGKIEENELPLDAMIREFKEETDVHISDWEQFLLLKGEDWEVYFFRSISDDIFNVKTMTSEEVNIYNVSEVSSLNVIDNLKWILPMCISENSLNAVVNI